ncbi:MAG: hypothetical protein ACOC8L_06710, partial [Spirochaetota bacterium]
MRKTLMLLVVGLLTLSPLTSQSISDSIAPRDIDTILKLIDAVALAEARIIAGAPINAADIATIEELVRIGDAIGAEDVAARARTLGTIVRPANPAPPDQPEIEGPLPGGAQTPLAGDGRAFRTWTTVLTVSGSTALALSGVMYALAERDYRSWQESDDESTRAELFQAWRGYELLSLGMGGLATLSLGVGLPLTYALSDPREAAATALSREVFTAEERTAQLIELYSARASIVTEINALPELEPRRQLFTTIGITA